MAHSSAVSESPSTAGVALPTEGVRTLVSFLIFVHLFALVVGVIANEGRAGLESTIVERVGLKQYLHLLGMDLPYSYHFTRGTDPGGELDIDYTIDAKIKQADGQTATVELPSKDVWPRQRFHRHQVLATRLAAFASEDAPNPDDLDRLLESIAAGLLSQYDVKTLDIRCRGRLTPPAMEEYQPDSDTVRYQTAYDGHAFLWDDRVELIKKEAARDTAPPPKDN